MFTEQSSHDWSRYYEYKNKTNGHVVHSAVWEQKICNKHKYYIYNVLSTVFTGKHKLRQWLEEGNDQLNWRKQSLHKRKWFLNRDCLTEMEENNILKRACAKSYNSFKYLGKWFYITKAMGKREIDT